MYERRTTMKNNEKTGKPAKNPTTNYRMDSHKFFCKRCYDRHSGICPATNRKVKSATCNI